MYGRDVANPGLFDEKGSWSDLLCDHNGSVGGCADNSAPAGETIISWTWDPTVTPAEWRVGCQGVGGTYFDP
jgi:hypothetical protein